MESSNETTFYNSRNYTTQQQEETHGDNFFIHYIMGGTFSFVFLILYILHWYHIVQRVNNRKKLREETDDDKMFSIGALEAQESVIYYEEYNSMRWK